MNTTPEQAEILLRVLKDLGEENLTRMHVASVAVYSPMHLGDEDKQTYADAVGRLVFTAMRGGALEPTL